MTERTNELLRRKWLVDLYYADRNGRADCGIVSDNGYAICRCPQYMKQESWESIANAIVETPAVRLERDTYRRQRDELVGALEKAIIHIAAIGMPLNRSGKYDKNGEWSFDEALPNKADGVEIKAAFDLIESSLAGVKEQQ